MSRLNAAPIALALAILIALPASGLARVELRGVAEASCSFGLGLTLRLCIDRGELTGGLDFSTPQRHDRPRQTWGGRGAGLLRVRIGAADMAEWGIPVVRSIIETATRSLNRD